jgi:hypothetical protein
MEREEPGKPSYSAGAFQLMAMSVLLKVFSPKHRHKNYRGLEIHDGLRNSPKRGVNRIQPARRSYAEPRNSKLLRLLTSSMVVEHPTRAARPSPKWGPQSFCTQMRDPSILLKSRSFAQVTCQGRPVGSHCAGSCQNGVCEVRECLGDGRWFPTGMCGPAGQSCAQYAACP